MEPQSLTFSSTTNRDGQEEWHDTKIEMMTNGEKWIEENCPKYVRVPFSLQCRLVPTPSSCLAQFHHSYENAAPACCLPL
jgi:hypothetical protein